MEKADAAAALHTAIKTTKYHGRLQILLHSRLVTYGEMVWALTLWASIGISFAYLCAAFYAATLLKRKYSAPFLFVFVIFSMFLGALFGFMFGGFNSIFISAIYASGNFPMLVYEAVTWGLGQAFFFILFSLGRFPFHY